jgi:hypothetical protein
VVEENILPQAGLQANRIVEAGTPEGAHGRRQPKETVMTELQSSQRRSYTAKTIFGLLLAVVMVAAFATAGSASPRSGQLHVTKECSEFTGLPNGFCTITGSNLNAIGVGMHVVYTDPTFVGNELISHLFIDGPGNNDANGNVALQVPVPGGIPDPNDWTGHLVFTDGTGRFSGFHANIFVDCRPSGSPCTWEGPYNFTPPGQ